MAWPLIRRSSCLKLSFSPRGWREIEELHQRVLANMKLAQNVLVTRDPAQARELVAGKARMRSAVSDSIRQHMQRLKDGSRPSVLTSNIHLETVRCFKTINSLMATIGYAVLEEAGEVLDSRLKSAS